MADNRTTDEIKKIVLARLGEGWSITIRNCSASDWEDPDRKMTILVNLCVDRYFLAYYRRALSDDKEEVVQIFLAEP